MIERAKALCRYWHHGQTDKAGRPYWEHPFAVAELVINAGPMGMTFAQYEAAICAAYLHDVLEDTECNRFGLHAYSVPQDVVAIVECLTRQPGEAYEAFIRRIIACGGRPAIVVKLADLTHNLDPDRRSWFDHDRCEVRWLPTEMIERYEAARDELEQALKAKAA